MGPMKRSAVFQLALSFFLAVTPAVARSQAEKEPPRFFGNFTTTPGAWSEYAVTELDGTKSSTMRNAIVGQEGDSFWYEVAITEGGVKNIIKMFLKGHPNNPENIQRFIIKNGDQPAQEMPREFVVLGRRMATQMFESRSGSSVDTQPGVRIDEVGSQPVTVPAGTFAATQRRIVDSTGKVLASYDFNPDILPFGVLRSETDKVKMELLAHGRDAVSLITEDPVMIKTPPGMPEGNPRGRPPGMPAPPATPPASGGYGR